MTWSPYMWLPFRLSAAIPPYIYGVVSLYVVTLQTICSHSPYMEWSPYMWLPFRLSATILHIWSGPPTWGYPSDYLQPFPHMTWFPLYEAILQTTCSHSPYMEWPPYMGLPFTLPAAIPHICSGPPICGYPSHYLQHSPI